MSEEKEVEDALIVLYKCSLKDKEYTTQKEQYKIVREYILQQQKEIEEIKVQRLKEINNTKYWVHKDKIKAKIKELEDNYSEHSEVRIGKCIEILQELLEE